MPVKPTNWNLNNKVLPDETDSSYKIESCEYMSEGDADNESNQDAAIDAMMNGQYLMNIPITVSYAFKKDGKGERHRSAAGSYFLPNRPSEEKSKSADPFVCGCTVSSPMIGFHAQIPASPQQINTGMSCPGIPPLIVSLTNIYGGYHAPGTNTQTITTTLSRMMGSISRTWTLFFSLDRCST
ncbi:hypothetical protein RhiirC2_844311 [Rhizophagus irregularis]|uniref:Uncharacterized protein n=1 Tax=Rhizophagus irregularis TaxID=588596 RepID=A0A2N1NUB9_9GLOM|nr:hypothetical protein RhiirC2_844311 [Rhizophagus irregularis]